MKKIFLVLFALIIAFPVYAQDKPDFSGTWKLDKEKSQLPDAGQSRRRTPLPDNLTIIQKGENISIESVYIIQEDERKIAMEIEIGGESKKIESAMMFGRRSADAGQRPAPTTIAKADWDEYGKSIVIIEDTNATFGERSFSFKTTSTYSLSANDKILNINRIRSSQRGDREYKLVYNKAE